MSTKPVFPYALLLALLGACLVRAQTPAPPPGPPPGTSPAPLMTGVNEVPAPTEVFPPPKPDKFICYSCPDCCGPVGRDGPIKYELFVRTGPSIKVGGGTPNGTFADGWMFEAGGRSLFVDADPVRAWTIELSISNVYNNGNRPNISYDFGGINVSDAGLNRTYVNLSGGREWWLVGTSCTSGWRWRAGADAGFRYGSAHHDMHDFSESFLLAQGQIQTNGSITYGPFAAIHSDIEFPCSCCTYSAGLRAEWDYSRMNVIPLHNNDLYDVNILLNFGVRY